MLLELLEKKARGLAVQQLIRPASLQALTISMRALRQEFRKKERKKNQGNILENRSIGEEIFQAKLNYDEWLININVSLKQFKRDVVKNNRIHINNTYAWKSCMAAVPLVYQLASGTIKTKFSFLLNHKCLLPDFPTKYLPSATV